MTSPTQRSLAQLRKDGCCAQVVERYNAFAHIRIDLFGFIDIVSINANQSGVTGIQTTSTGNMSARVLKILAIPEARTWLKCGNKIFVHGWSKKGAAGKRKTYQLKIKEITLEDFAS